MSKKQRLLNSHREILMEMAKNQRIILLERHPHRMYDIRYVMNSFPQTRIRPSTLARLKKRGLITLSPRGYYVISTKGQLIASQLDIKESQG